MSIIGTISILLLMIAVIIFFILIIIFSSGKFESNEVTKSSYVLGTLINLKAYGKKAEMAIAESIERLNNIDDKMSAFKENSEISRINFMAGVSAENVSDDTYLVVEKAIEYSKILEGTFDPTIRPLVKLWS